MPRTRTTKKLAQRIDLDYFKRSSPLRRWLFMLSVAAPALAILGIAWYGIRSDRRVYSAGNLSTAHAVLTKQCSACHLSNLGFYDAKVIDQKCIACHDGPLHHTTQEFTPACASCHADHRGAIRLAATSDANCTQCHANLATRGSTTSFVRNIGSFESNHPEFVVLRSGRRDPGTIQLNHYVHLQPNLLGPNGSRVQMVCADCHRSAADAGGPWPYGDPKSQAGTPKDLSAGGPKNERATTPPSRAYMAAATYAQTCAACHALQFDKRIPDAVPHDKPEVIHPFVVARLQAYIAAHPSELRVPRDPGRDLPGSPFPADYRMLTSPQWVAERTAEDEHLLWRKTCKQCHALVVDEGTFFPKSRRRISPLATCPIQTSTTRSMALSTAPAATRPPHQPAEFRRTSPRHRDVPSVPPRRCGRGGIALLRMPYVSRSRAAQTGAQQFFNRGIGGSREITNRLIRCRVWRRRLQPAVYDLQGLPATG